MLHREVTIRAVCALAAVLAGCIVFGERASAAVPWPPPEGRGFLFVHYGEEHWNDHDSDLTLPQVVSETVRYRPDLVTMSADKVEDGTVDQLEMWKKIMEPYDRAGIPYLAAIGNHDRKNPEGNGTLPAEATNYANVFASRPYPFGDAEPYGIPQMSPKSRPPEDPPGASTYYSADYGNVRWIFLDNSCYSFRICERVSGVNPPLPDAEGNATQMDFLRRRATEATASGKLVFVVMHMATDDPRDLTYSSNVDRRHAMTAGEQEADEFERIAAELGIDAVLVAHMKGQWLYEARGVPYYIDGGAGGELATTGPVGTDHGYWHGYRLIRVDGNVITTDTVPIFEAGTIRIAGPTSLKPGETAQFEATGKQPPRVQKVEALELRDPDPIPRGQAATESADVSPLPAWWILVLPMSLAVLAAAPGLSPRRRGALAGVAAVAALGGGAGTLALAQRSIPDSTPKENLANPARIWTSGNALVLEPVASRSEDPRRDPRTQTQDGTFRGRCPGATQLRITSGFEEASMRVAVPSARGRIIRRVRLRRTPLTVGRRATVARVTLAQPAQVRIRIRRGRRLVRVLRHACVAPGARGVTVRWDGRVRRRGKLVRVRPGRYRIEAKVLSDRRPVVRSRVLIVRGRSRG